MSANMRNVKKSRKNISLLTEPPPCNAEEIHPVSDIIAIMIKNSSITFAMALFVETNDDT
jgi:hypothetical protein